MKGWLSMSNVFERKVDPMLRIAIPNDLRKACGLENCDGVVVSSAGNVITIRPETSGTVTGSAEKIYLRRLDPMSRVTIPREVAEAHQIGSLDDVLVTVSDSVIHVTKKG